MARIDVDGIGLAYELVGDRGPPVAITPGGRFPMATAGVRQLAEGIAAAGRRVLIWDRPNTGASDVRFDGETESGQNADALAGLIRALDLGPTLLVGGSAGARDSLLATMRHPDVVRRLFVLWISGGPIGLTSIAYFYTHDAALAAASAGGMAAVAALPHWAETIARNPANRERLLAWDPEAFVAKMQAWTCAFLPRADSPVSFAPASALAAIDRPTMILRGGRSDIHHPRVLSETVAALIPNAVLAEPPWADREWVERLLGAGSEPGLFHRWPLLADQILAFDA